MQNAVKIGIFGTLALVVLGYIILRAEQIHLFQPKGSRVVAQFDSVAGLDDQAAVRIAGVRVGRVNGIDLKGRQAFVNLLIDGKVRLTTGTTAQIKNLGLLGDKYVELVPGSPEAPRVPEGSVIPGRPAVSIDEVISSIGGLGESLQGLAQQLAGQAPAQGPLGRLVVNLDVTSGQIRDLIAANRAHLDATVGNVQQASATLAQELPKMSQQLTALLAEVRGVVADNRGTLHHGLENVDTLTADLQTSVDNLNTITGRMARGEGTVGKLLNSDEAHDELVTTLKSVQSGVQSLSGTLNRMQKIQLDLAMQGFYLQKQHASHGEFRADIDPQSGHFYRLAVVNDPNGRTSTRTDTITTTLPDGTKQQETIQQQTQEDSNSASALFGFPVANHYRLWAGIIESRFGVEADYLPSPLWGLSFQAFDFNRANNDRAHVRLTGTWNPYEHLYVLGGADDPLVGSRRSLFLGIGIRWRDDDLKYLLGSLPKF